MPSHADRIRRNYVSVEDQDVSIPDDPAWDNDRGDDQDPTSSEDDPERDADAIDE